METPTIPEEIKEVPMENEYMGDTDSYMEEVLTQPKIIEIKEEPIINEPVNIDESKNIKTMGVAASIGVALGAVSLGAHSIIKNKDEDKEEEDFGYNR